MIILFSERFKKRLVKKGRGDFGFREALIVLYSTEKDKLNNVLSVHSKYVQVGLTTTTASPMAGYCRSHSFFLKMAMVAEF